MTIFLTLMLLVLVTVSIWQVTKILELSQPKQKLTQIADDNDNQTQQTETRTARNRPIRSRVHTFVRKLEEAISSGDKKNASEVFSSTMSELHIAVKKGVMRKNTASRKISKTIKKI